MRLFVSTVLFFFFWVSGLRAQETMGLFRQQPPASGQLENSNSLQHGIYTEGFRQVMFVIESLNKEDDESVMVFPHPAEQSLVVKVYDLDKGILRLQLSSQGSVVREKMVDSAEATHPVSFAGLPMGNYWLDVFELDRPEVVHRYKIRYTP